MVGTVLTVFTYRVRGQMFDKIFCLVIATGLSSSMKTAAGGALISSTNAQLDKVTAGSDATQAPLIASLLTNGANGPGSVNQFSPSIATLVRQSLI
jgi:hypothetical protein